MHPTVASAIHHVRENPLLFAAVAFVILESVYQTHGDLNKSMAVSCISWLAIWVFTVMRVGVWGNTTPARRKTSWLAGALLAFAKILDRVAEDREGTWATKSLLPLFVVLLSSTELVPKLCTLPTYDAHRTGAKDSDEPGPGLSSRRSYRILAVMVTSASIVLGCYAVPQTTALGTSSIIFAAAGLVTFHEAIRSVDDNHDGIQQVVSSHAPDIGASQSRNQQQLAVLRDVGGTMMVLCGVATCLLEIPANGAVAWIEVGTDGVTKTWQPSRDWFQHVWTLPLNAILHYILYIMISQQGAIPTSFLTVLTHMSAKLYLAPSFSGVWFTTTYVLSSVLYLFSMTASNLTTDKQSFVRTTRRAVMGLMVLSIVIPIFSYMTPFPRRTIAKIPRFTVGQPALPLEPVPIDLNQGHPAVQLIEAAEHNFDAVIKRQSTSLPEAVREYRRRNGIPPPPHFEKWYEFAVRNKVVMIDEFDLINDMLQPFWALKPSTIRSRITRELGGEDSALLGVSIRNGAIINIEKGDEWQQEATRGILESFVHHLPDMDLGFNIHDEPRVVVPTILLSRMVNKARDEVLPRVARNTSPRNAFSSRPEDMSDGKRFTETYVSNLNRFAHQQTWTQARLSCPVDSQSQTYEDFTSDNVTAYAVGVLGYIYNTTAFSDICISPSFSSSFGFFERPNAFSVVHELTPIFSQSKISSFQDILYPSPWYWASRVKYDATEDTSWDNKTNSLYWRGSTTGGFSRNSGWRRQHRQHIVQQLNAPDTADIITSDPKKLDSTSLSIQSVKRRDFQWIIDVHFSHVGQCDPSDCDAQKEFFHVTDFAQPQNAWYFKHLLDMDGNAFSGRFYSFLKSRSLTYKMAIFREWHEEWVKPWVHYVPFSLKGDEHLDLVNWFAGNPGPVVGGTLPNKEGNGDREGEKKAREIATRSTDWHDKVLRKVDMEVWFFRLLLEYGRVIDDNREEIGYPGP